LQDAFKIIDVLKAAKADNDLIKWAENEKVKAKEIFDDYLDESGWGLGLKALDKSETYIAKIDWPKVKPDRQIVLSSLASAADKIANKDYPLDRVEEGIHELRKDIRWILLYAQSLGGLVVRNDHVCPLPQYQPLTQTKLSDSKWGRLPPSVFEPDALEIPGCLYLGLTWHNQNISEAKDIGLWQEHIESLLRHKNPGLNPEQVQQEAARIIRRLPQWVDPVATARAEHVKIKASNILQEFSKAIRE